MINTKGKLLSICLLWALVFIAAVVLPQRQTRVWAAETTITVEDEKFYQALKNGLTPAGKCVDSTRKITLDMGQVTKIDIAGIDMKQSDSANLLKQLLSSCTQLKSLHMKNCDLSKFDLNVLQNVKSLTFLHLDKCKISDISFIKNTGGGLIELSLADNRLTDDAVQTLIDCSANLENLTGLSLGEKSLGGNSIGAWASGNTFRNTANLAQLPACFPKLSELDLTCLQIDSLADFRNVRADVRIDFKGNHIQDLSGVENVKFDLNVQNITLSGNFARGWDSEIPQLLKNILDETHPFSGSLYSWDHCRLSDDKTRLKFDEKCPLGRRPSVKVSGKGKLWGSTIYFELKQAPSYTIPQGLTATEGDTLAKVSLPEGFTWKDPGLDVGAAGTNYFKAVYSPINTEKFSIEIDIPVTVKKAVMEPADKTPEPVSPAPVEPTPVSPEPDPKPEEEPVQDESNLTGNQIDDRKDLSLLLATGKQKGKNGIELTWKKKNGCSGYEVYWSYCDGKRNYKKAITVKSTGKRSYTHKNLKTNRAYKYYIATYKIKNGKKVYQSKSPTIHVAMKEEKTTNVKSISVNKTKVSLKAKKTFQIKATAKAENTKKKLLAHTDKFRYYTNDKKVATVTKNGKIQAKKKGSCSIFVIANNGVSKEIKVTVK